MCVSTAPLAISQPCLSCSHNQPSAAPAKALNSEPPPGHGLLGSHSSGGHPDARQRVWQAGRSPAGGRAADVPTLRPRAQLGAFLQREGREAPQHRLPWPSEEAAQSVASELGGASFEGGPEALLDRVTAFLAAERAELRRARATTLAGPPPGAPAPDSTWQPGAASAAAAAHLDLKPSSVPACQAMPCPSCWRAVHRTIPGSAYESIRAARLVARRSPRLSCAFCAAEVQPGAVGSQRKHQPEQGEPASMAAVLGRSPCQGCYGCLTSAAHTALVCSERSSSHAGPGLRRRAGDAWHDAAAPAPKARSEGLVIAASLLDKAPNLGGLTRSGEAFGASKVRLHALDTWQELAPSARELAALSSRRPGLGCTSQACTSGLMVPARCSSLLLRVARLAGPSDAHRHVRQGTGRLAVSQPVRCAQLPQGFWPSV